MSLKFGIVGAGRIGQIHTRIFHDLGCEVAAVINLHLDRAQQVAAGYPGARASDDITALAAVDIDFVVVATPWQHHAEVIDFCCARGIPVYTEKPLFWHPGEGLDRGLERIRSWQDSGNLIMMNSPSARLVQAIPDIGPRAGCAGRVHFRFHTKGEYQGLDIGVDLLSHAWSVMHVMFGATEISIDRTLVSEQQFRVDAHTGACDITVDLAQDPAQHRLFQIEIDNDVWQQWQRGQGPGYATGIQHLGSRDCVMIPDPFRTNAQAFLTAMIQHPNTGHMDHMVWQQQMLLRTLDLAAKSGDFG